MGGTTGHRRVVRADSPRSLRALSRSGVIATCAGVLLGLTVVAASHAGVESLGSDVAPPTATSFSRAAEVSAPVEIPTPAEARRIAASAYVWGYATVDLYNILHQHALVPTGAGFLAPLNHVGHFRELATPEDTATIAPNVDTPYSYAWLDLRAGPVVVTVPPFDEGRYVSLQLVDLYTYILGYVTPRTNGRAGGDFLVAPPGWSGPTPDGIKQVFHSTTTLALGLFRTQWLGADDLDDVHRIQDGFRVRTLLEYLGAPAEPAAPLPPLVEPLNLRQSPTSPAFFAVLDWMLQFMPVLPGEESLRVQFGALGVRPGAPFDPPASLKAEIVDGMKAALGEMQQRAQRVRSSSELFGTRAFFHGDHLTRATGAMLGILGNSAEEFLGVGWQADANGQPFDGSRRYTIRFAPGELPPVGAFWSITVYTPQKLLYANPLHRYVVNSPMLPTLERDADGGITVYVQHDSPGKERESNWLPVPASPFGLTFRTYEPGDAIGDGRWRAPPVVPVE